jgi:hypothetical protein
MEDEIVRCQQPMFTIYYFQAKIKLKHDHREPMSNQTLSYEQSFLCKDCSTKN